MNRVLLTLRTTIASIIFVVLLVAAAHAQQSRESMANDATASQWSFQFAYQGALSYHQDTLSTGSVRPEGAKGFGQFRMVAPIPIAGGAAGGGVTILPRLTVRLTQSQEDKWGLSPTDLFALVVPLEWSWGRAGIGPDVVIPGKEGFGTTEWQYGFATAVIMRAFNEKLLFGVLLQQTWGKTNPSKPDTVVAGNLIINPFANLQLGKGFYLGTNDLQAQYNWDSKGVSLPVGLRFGYLLVRPNNTWNFYAEYSTVLKNDNWLAPAGKDRIRFNVSFTIPVG
jgi:hypothetical protein